MKKIKIAILWHFHQPYYKKDDRFILPWVRLHGVKDYKDLIELFMEFPKIKQTINIVPSMWIQINDYINNVTQDDIQILSKKKYSDFNSNDKKEFLRMFFLCNEQNMISPYPAYEYLFQKSKNMDFESFTPQEILDIQVWYNLTWIGQFSRQNPFIKRLFQKANNFTEEERDIVLSFHNEILSLIKPRLQTLKKTGNLEISISPFYHPILPLLCNSNSILESMPDAFLPDTLFNFPEDASNQIKNSIDFYNYTFTNENQNEIIGMWPSEGSLSNESIEIMIDNNIKWAASDEKVLSNSLKNNYQNYHKYFPIKYKGSKNDENITLFFRDNSLSDAIGFEYSKWDPFDAANDFINRIINIKRYLINELNEECLDYAVIPIILDGENCWEFYKDNGVHFLRTLFNNLENNNEIETVLFKENVSNFYNIIPELTNLQAGSWINGNFNIWGGHNEHRIAWSILAETRKIVKEKKDEISKDILNEVMNYMFIAEGSDWFWWYGDSHWAENKYDFDDLFRYNLSKVYQLLKLPTPEILQNSINNKSNEISSYPPKEILNFDNINFNNFDSWCNSSEWNNAGFINLSSKMASMHKVGELIKNIYYGNNHKYLFIKIELYENLHKSSSVELSFIADNDINKVNIKFEEIIFSNKLHFINHILINNNYICISIDLSEINDFNINIVSINQEAINKYDDIKFKIIKYYG